MTHKSIIMLLIDHVEDDFFSTKTQQLLRRVRVLLRKMMRGKHKHKALTFILIKKIAFRFAVGRYLGDPSLFDMRYI